jgi:bacterioferritin (cytochrome b1)
MVGVSCQKEDEHIEWLEKRLKEIEEPITEAIAVNEN